MRDLRAYRLGIEPDNWERSLSFLGAMFDVYSSSERVWCHCTFITDVDVPKREVRWRSYKFMVSDHHPSLAHYPKR